MHVCAACIADPDLARLINREAVEKDCSFCGRTSRRLIAADLGLVSEEILRCLGREYGEPAGEGVGWDSGEGGWQSGSVWDTWDLLTEEVQLELPNDGGELLKALCDALGDQEWCYRDPYGMDEHDRLRWSWGSFCDFIKHRRRYFFLTPQRTGKPPHLRREELLEPAEMLQRLSEVCRDMQLFSRLAAGTPVWRSRRQPAGETCDTAKDLGPPPESAATQANRMSAAGISIFYGAMKASTAIAEVRRGRKGTYATGKFQLCRDVWTLDLTNLPPVPGLFCEDDAVASQRPVLLFLHGFVRDISKTIARDHLVHIDYVPTQVVTEYFRVLVSHEGAPISAIIYPSAKQNRGRCIAVFAEPKDVSDGACTSRSLLTLASVAVSS